jgi:hypothetical protein
MQSDGGSTFVGNSASNSAQQTSITQMVIDGTQGTSLGDGLVQCINQYGNIYEVRQYPMLKLKSEITLIILGCAMLQLGFCGQL